MKNFRNDTTGEVALMRSVSKYATGVRWSLNDVLPARSGELFTSFLRELEGRLEVFESLRNELNAKLSPDIFASVLEKYEQIVRMRSRLGSYAYMSFSEDTRSQDSRTFKGRAEEIDTDASNRTLYFELWWKGLNEEESRALIQSAPESFRYFLVKLRKTKPYTLPEEV